MDRLESKEKRITDIGLATYLSCIGMAFKKIERSKFKSSFVYDTKPELQEETDKYFNHKALVDPLKYSETLRNLKSFVRQG